MTKQKQTSGVCGSAEMSCAKMVAEKLGLKAQPIVIKDLSSFYNEVTKRSKRGTVHIEILPPVEFKEGWLEKNREDMIAV